MNAWVSWRRPATLFAAVLIHIALLWAILQSTISRPAPLPDDSVEVAIVPPAPPPKPLPPPKPVEPPKPVRAKPADRPAETNSSEGRAMLRPAPRLAKVIQPPADLALPEPVPLLPKPPVSVSATSGAAGAGAPSNGSGAGETGAGKGSQEGNDYLVRLKAYIDAHRGRARHREPHDAEVAIVLDQEGVSTDIHIVTSTGDPAVDDEIITQLKQMGPFPKPPAILFSASKPLLSVVDKWIFPRP